jgi:hypothetical protein
MSCVGQWLAKWILSRSSFCQWKTYYLTVPTCSDNFDLKEDGNLLETFGHALGCCRHRGRIYLVLNGRTILLQIVRECTRAVNAMLE